MVKQADIDAQLRRILASPTFSGSPRCTQFLRFCVQNGVNDQASHLKETTIAVEVFNRPADYNPKNDPIVRVHARRVREKLDLYYRTAGSSDPIRIDLPKGRYIPLISRTLPSRKIDFTDWEPVVVNVSEVLEQQPPMIAAPARKQSKVWLGIAILLIALASFSLAWVLRGVPVPTRNPISELRPMDLLAGNVSDPAWSRDGSQLAFTAADAPNGITHIYIETPASGRAPTRITHDDGPEMKPIWSPDGSELVFIHSLDLSRFEVMRLHLKDGTSSSVGQFNTMAYVSEEHPALDWSSDGQLLLTTEQMSTSSPMRLVLISLRTGERRALTAPPTGSTGDIDGKFSPDGQRVAFRRGGLGDLYVVSTEGEQAQLAKRLTYDMKGVRGIAWADNGGSILFGTQRGPTNSFGIWTIPASGGVPRALSPPDFDAVDPALLPTGNLLLRHRALVTQLMAHPLDNASADRAILPSDWIDEAAVYSPDGGSIAFVSSRSGWDELWQYRLGDPAPTQITHLEGAGYVFFPVWSPDSRSISFSFRQNSATNLYTYSRDSGVLKQITTTHNRDIGPQYSADGRYLYYSSNDDGTSRLWRIPTSGTARPEPLFWEAVMSFLPSSDGKWMYFVESGQSLSLIRRNLEDGTKEEIFRTSGSPSFTIDLATANGLIYLGVSKDNASQSEILQIDPESRATKVVAHLSELPPMEHSSFTVSPDGRTLIIARATRNESSFYTAAAR